jgi:pyruvate formate lyase activating enzyme
MFMSLLGAVHSIETFGASDGPGVRFVIFLQGCKMRCLYCHNADTWQIKEGNSTPEELIQKALRYRPYWKQNGGITLSGGEPLLQMEFACQLFAQAKKAGIHTVLDTSGQPFENSPEYIKKLDSLMANTDLVLLDIKQIYPLKHKKLCGYDNANILEFARYLDSIHKPVWIRHVLVEGYSDIEEDLRKLADFLDTLNNIEKVQVLPYHDFGAYKWKELGMPYLLDESAIPKQDQILQAEKILHADHSFTPAI